MHMREKGKRPLLLKHTPSGRESRASCQGTTFHFPDMRLKQERGGRRRKGGCGVRASAGPLGTPLPGGGKSMWFLSYLWEGWSTASNTGIQWVAKGEKKERTLKMKTLLLVSHSSPHLFIKSVPVKLAMRVWICRWTDTHTRTQTPRSAWTKHEGTGLAKSTHQSMKRCQIKKTQLHPGC